MPHAVPAVDQLLELPGGDGKAPYTVLYLFDAWSTFARKNPLAAIRVFQQAFKYRHDVRLVLKGHRMQEHELAELKTACSHDSRITVINHYLSAAELREVFARVDVLLSLQRGEGFGLNIARAMGMGLPVITTGWGGQLDFCTPDTAFLVPYRIRNVREVPGHSFADGHWAEPDEEAAALVLAQVDPAGWRGEDFGRGIGCRGNFHVPAEVKTHASVSKTPVLPESSKILS